MDYKAIIFDLDGTLLDSMKVWNDVDERFIKAHKIVPPDNLSDIMKTLSFEQSAEYFIDTFSLDMTIEEVTDEFRLTAEDEYKNNVLLKPYAEEFIIKNKDVPMCVATATNHSLAESALKRLDIIKYFDFIITCTETGKGKEDPEIFLESARRLGFPPSDILVVEDSLHAAVTAKNSGFNVLGIFDDASVSDEKEMRKICSRYIFSYKELI